MPLALHSFSAKERRADSIKTDSRGCITLTGAEPNEDLRERVRHTHGL
jgi:hypothetical protein